MNHKPRTLCVCSLQGNLSQNHTHLLTRFFQVSRYHVNFRTSICTDHPRYIMSPICTPSSIMLRSPLPEPTPDIREGSCAKWPMSGLQWLGAIYSVRQLAISGVPKKYTYMPMYVLVLWKNPLGFGRLLINVFWEQIETLTNDWKSVTYPQLSKLQQNHFHF